MAILLLLISFGTISAVAFTPALPELSRAFGISETAAQSTMSLYLVGYTLGQLPYGPLANRFGRKKAIYIGIALMLLGSLLAIAATSFWVLALGRFIQALGGAAGLKLTFTMISDQHGGQTATRAISFLSLAFALAPAVGVAIGGGIVAAWGWRGCFLFLALYSIFLALLVLALPETKPQIDRDALHIKRIAHGYWQQFKSKTTVINALLMGGISSSFYVYATLSPYVGIRTIGLTPDAFGLWNLVMCLGLFGGVAFTQWFSRKDNPRGAMGIGIAIMAAASIALFILFDLSIVNVWTLFFIPSAMRIGSNTIWSNASIQGLSAAHDKSNASAVMQFLNLSAGTVSVFLVSAFPPSEILLLPSACLAISALLILLWLNTARD